MAKEYPTAGFAFRPGFHCTPKPEAPHLKLKDDRVWVKVRIQDYAKIKKPDAQGGIWFLANDMKIIGEV